MPGPDPEWTAIGEGIADGSDLHPRGERDRNQPWQPQEHKEKAPRVMLTGCARDHQEAKEADPGNHEGQASAGRPDGHHRIAWQHASTLLRRQEISEAPSASAADRGGLAVRLRTGCVRM